MKMCYILLVEKGSYLKHIADWSQIVILLILVIAAYFVIKKALK